MTIDLPPSPIETAVEEIEEAVEEAVEEIKEVVEEVAPTDGVKLDPECLNEIVTKTADKVYDKLKVLVTDVIQSMDDAAEIAAATAPEPAAEQTIETEPTEEEKQDIKPKSGHKLFRKPLKKEE